MRSFLTCVPAAACAIAACGQSSAPAAETAAAAAPADALASSAAGPRATAAPASAAASTAAPQPAAAPGGSASLQAYVGKYPFDEVDGVSWNANPAVAAAVRKTITDPALRKTLADTAGPSAPIEMIDGKISAWACQAHNCGDHQWMVMIDPASGAADVCYHQAEATPGRSRWYRAAGGSELRDGNCTVE